MVNTQFMTVIDDITFVSETQSGLDNLVNNYNALKIKNSVASDYFIKNLGSKGAIIVDILLDGHSDSCCIGKIVYSNLQGQNYNKHNFFHEGAHFIDNDTSLENLTTLKPVIDDLQNNKMSFIDSKTKQFLERYNNDSKKIYNNLSKCISDFENLSKENKEYLCNVRRETIINGVLEEWCVENGYCAISDILSALYQGKNSNLPFSHSASYYS